MLRNRLFRLAHHFAVGNLRSRGRRRESGLDRPPEPATRVRDGSGPGASLLERALSTLNPADRAVILHAYYGRLTTADIAERAGIPEDTVKSRLHYGVTALRAACHETGPTDPNHRT
ncbi:MAG TPA: sigma factor-like helix-turn-helix DNA-binding protein [Aldersonia sp.]